MTVYKYLHPDRSDVLEKANIRITQATDLNDPFELLPSVTEFRKQSFAAAGGEEALSKLALKDQRILKARDDAAFKLMPAFLRQTVANQFLFLCLTRKRNNLLMWSHYAHSHRGFVIGFDEENAFFKPDGPGKWGAGLRPVIYSSARHSMRFTSSGRLTREEQLELIDGTLFTKSPDWSYEEELRIIFDPSCTSSTSPDGSCHLISFPRESVQEVILGSEMEEQKRLDIAEIVDRDYPGTKIFVAEAHADRFALNIIPYI